MVGANDDRRGDVWDDQDDDRLETEQLQLNEPDERLPWLESADDDDDGDQDGYDTGRLVLMFVAALALLGVVVGGIWWLSNRGPDPELIADGSVVPAPAEPYKTAPANPGGKTFDGTGDLSFAASEGQSRTPVMAATEPAAPAPAAPVAAPSQANAAAAASANAPAAAPVGVGVQVGAFSSKATADAGWTKLEAQANGALSGVSHRVIAGTADNGTIYRLQAVASDKASAVALCTRLKAIGISCQVK
jgi:hypothetical protein